MKQQRSPAASEKLVSPNAREKPSQVKLEFKIDEGDEITLNNSEQLEVSINVKNNIILISLIMVIYRLIELQYTQMLHGFTIVPETIQKSINVLFFIGQNLIVYRSDFQTKLQHFQPSYYAQILTVLIFASFANNGDASDPMILGYKILWTALTVLNVTFYQYLCKAGTLQLAATVLHFAFCKRYGMGMDMSEQVCMFVCLFFPFENLDFEVVNTEDDQSIRGYRGCVINILIKYKMNATKAINNILNQKREPLYKQKKQLKLYNDLRQQSQKIVQMNRGSVKMALPDHLIIKSEAIKQILSSKTIQIKSDSDSKIEKKKLQKSGQKSKSPQAKPLQKLSEKKQSDSVLNNFLDEIKEELDEENSVSLNDDSLSIATSGTLDKFDQIQIACSPPLRTDENSGKRNYMNDVVKDMFNENNFKTGGVEIINDALTDELESSKEVSISKLNLKKKSKTIVQVQNKFSFGSSNQGLGFADLTAGIASKNSNESPDENDIKHFKTSQQDSMKTNKQFELDQVFTGSFELQKQSPKKIVIPELRLQSIDSLESFVNSPAKIIDKVVQSFTIQAKEMNDDNTSEIFYQQFQSQGGQSEAGQEDSSHISSQSLSNMDTSSDEDGGVQLEKVEEQKELKNSSLRRRKLQDNLTSLISEGVTPKKQSVIDLKEKGKQNIKDLNPIDQSNTPNFVQLSNTIGIDPFRVVKPFQINESRNKKKQMKTFIDLPQIQLNQKKKQSTKNCLIQRPGGQTGQVKATCNSFLRSNTINIDKQEAAEVEDAQDKKSQYTIDLRNQQIQYFRQKATDQENYLENTKSFLNMIIHELRSPANQLKYKVQECIEELKQIRTKQEKQVEESEHLHQIIEELVEYTNSNSPRFGVMQSSINLARQLDVIPEDDNAEVPVQDQIQIKSLFQNNKVIEVSFNNNGLRNGSCGIIKNKSSSNPSNSNMIKCRSLDQRKLSKNESSGYQESSIDGDEQIPQAARGGANSHAYNYPQSSHFDEQFENDDKNRARTTYIGKLSDKLSEIDTQKQQFYMNLPDYQKNYRQKSLKTLLEGQSKNYLKEQELFQITEQDMEPNLDNSDVREKKLSSNLDLVHKNLSLYNSKLNMSTQTEICKDFVDVNQSQIKEQKRKLALLQTELSEQILSHDQETYQVEKVIDNLLRCDYCSKMLLNHINDLLDFAKLEKNKFIFFNEFFDLTQTIRNTIQDVEYMSKGKNIQPQFVIDQNVELFFKDIYGDEARYTQIFLNFLSNAFKFTPENGQITIEIKPHGEQFSQQINDESQIQEIIGKNDSGSIENQLSAKKKLLIQNNLQGSMRNLMNSEMQIKGDALYYVAFQLIIKDSGRGISLADQEKLFIKFNMVGNSQDGNKQGTGLGLSICKHFITKMGGDVKVKSDGIGHGTSFIINLRAISKLSEVKRKEHMQMLHVDVIAKNNLFKEKKIQNQLQQKYQSSLKKMNKSELDLSKYSKFIQEQPQEYDPNVDQTDAKQKVKKMIGDLKALVINDELFILESLQEIVKEVGIQDVDRAINGLDAQFKIQQKDYDFIICDINMPVMNGYDFATKLFDQYKEKSFFNASNCDERQCPYLIACTSESSPGALQKCREYGFKKIIQFLTLPILEDEILKEVFKLKKEHQMNSSMPKPVEPSIIVDEISQSISEPFSQEPFVQQN